jgi:hypothetical protein
MKTLEELQIERWRMLAKRVAHILSAITDQPTFDIRSDTIQHTLGRRSGVMASPDDES